MLLARTPVFFPLNIRFTSGIREVTNVEIKVWRANKFGRFNYNVEEQRSK